jgi:hypothetical protein
MFMYTSNGIALVYSPIILSRQVQSSQDQVAEKIDAIDFFSHLVLRTLNLPR